MSDFPENPLVPAQLEAVPLALDPDPSASRRIEGEDQPDLIEDGDETDDASDAIEPEDSSTEHGDSWWGLAVTLFFAVLLALGVRTFMFQPYNIPSGSMEDTLLVGDYLFVEKFSYGYSKYSFPWGRLLPSFERVFEGSPKRGDVVVFALPSDPSTVFIKRLVGLPGDRIQMLGGVLNINGKPVPKLRTGDYVTMEGGYERRIARYRETLPGGKSYDVLDSIADGPVDTTEVYFVPIGHYFMMGDNRDDSDDSRIDVGYVPAENLVGKAEFKFFSIDGNKAQWWKFWTWPRAIRFDRMFTFID